MAKVVFTVGQSALNGKWIVFKNVNGTSTVYNRFDEEYEAVDEASVMNMVSQHEEDDDIYHERHNFSY